MVEIDCRVIAMYLPAYIIKNIGREKQVEKRNPVDAKFNNRALLIFAGGFLGGLLLIYTGQERLVANTTFLDSVNLTKIGTLNIDSSRLLFYSLKQRLWPAGLLIFLTVAGAGSLTVCVCLMWSGFCAGVILSVLSLRYGIRGILLFAAGILPQALLLIPAYLLLFRWCILFPTSGGPGKRPGLMFMIAGGRLFRILAMLLTGCIVESYLNPLFLHAVFRLF